MPKQSPARRRVAKQERGGTRANLHARARAHP